MESRLFPEEPGAATLASTPAPPPSGSPELQEPQPLRILMLEDVETDAELVSAELRRAELRFVARRVETCDAFLYEIDAFRPDLILADYSMPQFTALEALAALDERGVRLPFIIVTGTQTEEIAVQCIQSGADDYILKDSLTRLPSAVLRALRVREELQAAQLQLIQAEKMESVGRLAAGVAHEVKNPLTVLLMGVEYLRQRFATDDNELLTLLEDMETAARKASGVIRGLLDFSLPSTLDRRPESMQAIVDSALGLLKHEFARSRIQIERRDADQVPELDLDRVKMEQVFVNLFLNAVHAMPSGGCLGIEMQMDPGGRRSRIPASAELRPRRALRVEVSDTGSGIQPEVLTKVFDPFFTTKPVGKGTGLGLTVVKKIIEMHGGSVVLRNRPEGG